MVQVAPPSASPQEPPAASDTSGWELPPSADPDTGVTRPRPHRLLPFISELKILTKDLKVVRLGDVINHAQIDFVERCERQLEEKGQIRICVLKARQIGISTIIEAIAFAMSILHDNFNSLIVSHEDKSAAAILGMTKRYWATYLFRQFHTETYNGKNHLAWANGADIDIATAKNVGAGRSQTIQFLHASEVAFWPDPKTLMTGLHQAIPTYGLNCIFIESTANGVGNYFHQTCNKSMKGENEFEFVFYPWHEHPEYTAAFIPDDQRSAFTLDNLDEEELQLRDRFGISDARLLWRRWAIANRCQGDVVRFHQEYPTTPHEAFVSTGRNVFPLHNMLEHYEPLEGKVGRLIQIGRRIKFVDDPGGPLTLFAEPSDDADWGVYLLGGDPTHTTAGDYACIQVLNRRTLEQVAVYRRKIDPINFGKDMQMLGRYFNDGMLAPERTGPGYATIGCIVSDMYPNVYATQNIAKMPGFTANEAYGWVTNQQTKHLAISHLLKALLDPPAEIGGQQFGLMIHDQTTFLEMRDYVTTEDGGSYENSDGSEYDDGVMALAIACAVHAYEPPPAPYEVTPTQVPRYTFLEATGTEDVSSPTSYTGPRVTSGSTDMARLVPSDTRVARTADGPVTTDEVDRLLSQARLPRESTPDMYDLTNLNPPDEAPWETWGEEEGH